ncbi:MAG: sulfatase-like hydrolase/transferase [Rhizobacter sp.]|nr:sulfatase-like hydrolase/transferase [Ferruginibacter sp.]
MSFHSRLPKLLRWIISTILLLLVLMFLYRFLFFYTYGTPGRSLPGSAILLGLRYDARIVSVIGIAMLLLSLFPFFNPFKNRIAKKIWPIILTIIFCIFLFAYVADFYHYDYLKERLNASVLGYLEDAAISFGMMRQSYPIVTISIILIILLLAYWWLAKRMIQKIDKAERTVTRKNIKWYFIPAVLIMGGLVFGRLNQYPLRWSDAFSLGDDFKAHTALNPFQTFLSSLKFKNATYDLNKVKEYYPAMAQYFGVDNPDINSLNFNRAVNFPDSSAAKTNVVVIICESFSAYKSSMFGNRLNPTPYFNQLSGQGVFFERCFTPAFGTARGVWATITGIPDVQYPITSSRNPAAVNQHSIMNDFTAYDKFYFLGGSTSWANIRGVLDNNIDRLKIFEEDSFDAARVDVWGISDKSLFLAANKEFSKQTKPFIAVIQTAGNHRPYTIPSEDLPEFKMATFPEDSLRNNSFISNAELNAFRYADFSMQKFIEAAKKEKYFDNTVFVFVGDHGLIGDAGTHFPVSFTKQGIGSEHVPLLFYSPKLLQPKKVLNVCSQLDVLPSAAYIARQNHTNTTMGKNLFDTSDSTERFAFIADPNTTNVGVVSNEYYWGRNIKTKEKFFVSVVNNNPVAKNTFTDSISGKLEKMTGAWYETSKYLLLNNKKRLQNK